METDNWSDVMSFSTSQHAVMLIDPEAQCVCCDDINLYWIRMADGYMRTVPCACMVEAWGAAVTALAGLYSEPTGGSMLDRMWS